jgi:hypothetical protein
MPIKNFIQFPKTLWQFEYTKIFQQPNVPLRGRSRLTARPKNIKFYTYKHLFTITIFLYMQMSYSIFFNKIALLQHLLTLRPNTSLFNSKVVLTFLKLNQIKIFNKFTIRNSIPHLKLITFIRKSRILFQYYTRFWWRQKTLSKSIQKFPTNYKINKLNIISLIDIIFNTCFFTNYKIIKFLIKRKYILINNKFIDNPHYNLTKGDFIFLNYSINNHIFFKKHFFSTWRKKKLYIKPIIISTLKQKKKRLLKNLQKINHLKKTLINLEIDYTLNIICYVYNLKLSNHITSFSSLIPYKTIKNLNWKYYF